MLNIFSISSMTNQLCLLLDMLENSARETSSGRIYQLKLLQNLWSHVRELEHKKILELITHPSVVLFDAIKSGNVEVVKWLLYMNRELLTIRDPKNGRNLLYFAVLYRQHSIFKYILKMGTVNLILRAVDKDNRNNVLHFAAQQPKETPSSLRPHILMQKQLMWFMVNFLTLIYSSLNCIFGLLIIAIVQFWSSISNWAN